MSANANAPVTSPAKRTARTAATPLTRAAIAAIMAIMAIAAIIAPCSPAFAEAGSSQGEAGSSTIQSVEDLSGKRLGTLVGTTCYDVAQQYCGADGEVLGFNAVGDLPQALEGNKIDAYIIDGPSAEFSAAQHANFRILEDYLSPVQYAYMFPKSAGDDNIYLRQMNELLAQLKATGAPLLRHQT